MMDQKDHTIQAQQELINELIAKLINLRVQAGMRLEEREVARKKEAVSS